MLRDAGKLSDETVKDVQRFILENNTFRPRTEYIMRPRVSSVFDKFGPKVVELL